IKAAPDKYNYATSGAGTPFHVDMEFLMQLEQLEMKHIPYKGVAPALQDVVAGRVEMMLIDAGPALPLIKAGRLNAIAVASAKRIPQLPDVPTLKELGVEDRDLYAWQGLI